MGYFEGKTVIVTGGGRAVLSDGRCGSIGYGIATAFAKEGANLVLTGRNMKKLTDAKEELERLYGVNFAETWESQREFDRLINLIHAWRIYKMPADVYWYATNITNLPNGIIQRIWPQNTDDILADILISAYKVLVDYEKAGEPARAEYVCEASEDALGSDRGRARASDRSDGMPALAGGLCIVEGDAQAASGRAARRPGSDAGGCGRR